MSTEQKKISLLFYGDSPTCSTGFATVSKNILKRLHETGLYDITVMGINYYGDPHDLPYKIYPASANPQGDVYGRQRLLDLLRDKKNNFDILFTLQDTFIMATIAEHIKKLRDGHIETKEIKNEETGKMEVKKVFVKGREFKWLYYFPIDANPKKEWINVGVKYADIAVPYTHYAEKKCKEILDRKYDVIYHGFDKKDFYIMTEEEKQEFRDKYFKPHDLKNKFFLINVNRNQERKGLLQTLLVFKLIKMAIPNVVMYMHCDMVGDRGGNLLDVANQLGINEGLVYPNPEAYARGIEFPTKYINGLYNIADANISTTYGEGFGLSMVEAMACKTINIFPKNTAITEILSNNRGILVKSGNTANNLIMNGPLDNNLIRPVIDVEDMVNKIIWAYRNPEEVAKIEENAYNYAQENLTWDKVANEFNELIKTLI